MPRNVFSQNSLTLVIVFLAIVILHAIGFRILELNGLLTDA